MIIITLPYLYAIYGIIISLVCLTVLLAQYYNSEKLLHYLCLLCAASALYVPIFLKYHSPWTQFTDGLDSIFSAVTGFLFALKILELAFTYEWSIQRQIAVKQILMDFSTFPKYKYEPELPFIKLKSVDPTILNHLKYLILGTDDEKLSARRQNILIILRGLSQLICLHILLRLTPYSMLRLHSRNANFFSICHFLTYTLYGFMFYFVLGMIINIVFGLMGFIWNIYIRSIYPGYPFLPTSLHDFWSRRWNIYVKSILHRISFIALPKLTGFNEKSNARIISAGIFAFFVSGLLHEFMYTVSMNRWSGGKNMLFFLINGIFVGVELVFQEVLKQKQIVPPVLGWIYTIVALYSTSSLFCDPWIEVDCFATLKTHLG
ncbi:unnamed protein product [Rotaria socialis]|uniref:Wax synthase domain-containing protein n=1 Tax=Rotaria socialis TaxID=392032 RepID=A0A817T3G8_9BILA|nr:unnamed protein product [Rotaria socialis]CAF3348973.1 unnamed protein product [Rotaria socialis]CAF3350235.1 unnamed protein product [Rotaria socialis]CAF4107058.1 unnamed protein product [Rotaria socialis]CAF4456756.1 unnamed protein product [Rotaria socialis]